MKLRCFTGPVSTGYVFWCPGCEEAHTYDVPRWSFNGDMDKPTFTPSLLYPEKKVRCHLFVRAGKIEYCGDCGHALAGQTVDLPDLPAEWEGPNQ